MLLLAFALCLRSFSCVLVFGCVCSGAGCVVVALRVVVTAGGLPPHLCPIKAPTTPLPTSSVSKILNTLGVASCGWGKALMSG